MLYNSHMELNPLHVISVATWNNLSMTALQASGGGSQSLSNILFAGLRSSILSAVPAPSEASQVSVSLGSSRLHLEQNTALKVDLVSRKSKWSFGNRTELDD